MPIRYKVSIDLTVPVNADSIDEAIQKARAQWADLPSRATSLTMNAWIPGRRRGGISADELGLADPDAVEEAVPALD